MQNRFWNNMSITNRLTLSFVAVILIVIGFMIGAKSAFAASLKPVSVVTSDTITLGDIFDNVGRNSDYVVGPSPQPGQDMTLNARTLYRIATALDVQWRPATSMDQITIRRDATVVSYDKIETSLRNALEEKGVNGRFDLKFSGAKPSIVLPENSAEMVEVSSVTYDHNKNIFKATLVAPSRENPIKKIEVGGMVNRLTSVPVLASTLQSGDIIGENDIQMIEISQSDVQNNMIINKNDIIGMTPRRLVGAGKFIQMDDLIKPQLVQRGESVEITFTEGMLVLTAKGKALESGAKGDIVRVTNANSSRTVDATVVGQNQVIVR